MVVMNDDDNDDEDGDGNDDGGDSDDDDDDVVPEVLNQVRPSVYRTAMKILTVQKHCYSN